MNDKSCRGEDAFVLKNMAMQYQEQEQNWTSRHSKGFLKRHYLSV